MSLKMGLGLACNLCGECVEVCPSGSLTITDDKLQYNSKDCQFCEVCMDVCQECAIRIYEDISY